MQKKFQVDYPIYRSSRAWAWQTMDVQSEVIFVWLVSEFYIHTKKISMNFVDFCVISIEKWCITILFIKMINHNGF